MNKEKTNKVLDYFEELFPDAHCELNHQNVFELLVAVMLSAQTTDKKVHRNNNFAIKIISLLDVSFMS